MEPAFEPGKCASIQAPPARVPLSPGRGGPCSGGPWWAQATTTLRMLETSVRSKSSPHCALKKEERSPFQLLQGREPVMLNIGDGPSSGSIVGIKPGPATSDGTDTSVSSSSLCDRGKSAPRPRLASCSPTRMTVVGREGRARLGATWSPPAATLPSLHGMSECPSLRDTRRDVPGSEHTESLCSTPATKTIV